MTVTHSEPRLFGLEAVPVTVKLPATAQVVYLYDDDEPTGDFVALDIEALALARLESWEALIATETLPLRLRVSDFVYHYLAEQEATLLGFADWPAVVGWKGTPSRWHGSRIVVDDVAVAKVLAFELARTGRTPVEVASLRVSAHG